MQFQTIQESSLVEKNDLQEIYDVTGFKDIYNVIYLYIVACVIHVKDLNNYIAI